MPPEPLAGALPRLGVGAVYWTALHDLFARHPDLIAVAEVEPSPFWVKAPGPGGAIRSNLDVLEAVAGLPQAKLVHGVGYPIGGTHCDHATPITEQRRWAERLGAAWTSEHLSFNETAIGAAGFLLPPCQSEEGVALAAVNIRRRAAALGRPFAFETGVSYVAPRADEMADGAFFAAVAEAADCHILLDLHNLWTNERNGRARVKDVVAALPLDRVCEIHLAGGVEKDGYWLDSHSGLVAPDLLALAAEIVPDLPALGAILFELAPEYLRNVEPAAFLRQIEALHPLWERSGRAAGGRKPPLAPLPPAAKGEPAAWEEGFVRTLSQPGTAPGAPAIDLYRALILSFRKGALAGTLTYSLRLLQLVHGEPAIDGLLADYARATGPLLYPGDETLQFCRWLRANGPETAYLEDMLALEEGIVFAACVGRAVEVELRHDPSLIVAAIARGTAPRDLPAGDFRIGLGAP